MLRAARAHGAALVAAHPYPLADRGVSRSAERLASRSTRAARTARRPLRALQPRDALRLGRRGETADGRERRLPPARASRRLEDDAPVPEGQRKPSSTTSARRARRTSSGSTLRRAALRAASVQPTSTSATIATPSTIADREEHDRQSPARSGANVPWSSARSTARHGRSPPRRMRSRAGRRRRRRPRTASGTRVVCSGTRRPTPTRDRERGQPGTPPREVGALVREPRTAGRVLDARLAHARSYAGCEASVNSRNSPVTR